MKKHLLLLLTLLSLCVGQAWGVEFLVIADTKNSGDKYDIGNPVSIRPDGWQWGRLEGPPTFIVVRCPGMSVKEARKYMASDETITGEGELQEITTHKIAKYRFNLTRLLNAQSSKSAVTIDKDSFDKEWTDTTKEVVR